VPEAIVLLDTDNRILQVNREFTRVFGYAQEEACGRLINELVVPEELLAEAQEYAHRGVRGESLNVEAVRKHKDGTRVHVSILRAPVSIAGSQICQYVIYRDISERKRAEQRLSESEAYLAEAQRLSETGSWAWNPATGDIRYWSEMCYRVLGFDPAGPLPRFAEFFHRIHPDDQAALRERFDKAIRDKADFELDYRIVHPERAIRHIHAVGHAVLDGSGNLSEFVGTVIDVTERKRAEQEVRESEADLRTKNDRLKLLLNVTNQITSSLELREVLRAVSSNIRDVMHYDAVFVSLVDSASGTPRLYVLDFPQSKGFINEETVYTISGAGKRVLETLKPLVVDLSDPAAVPPEIYDKVVAEGLKSACLIPLVNRGRVVGGLTIARATETSFAPEDVEFLSQASGQIAIAIENALTFEEVCKLRDKLAQEKLYLEEEIRSDSGFERIIGKGAALKHVLQLVETVAPSDSTVLLLGETGTGKELIARAIHERSRRQNRTFVKLNCAAIPTGLLESELFGHEKGAFTGAITQKIGRLELADQGTLFLDEVGDIPTEIQPKLLRALQEREFERLGSTHTRKVNVRLVAATNRNLEKMVADREFRSDLFYRLNVFPIRIPPLRERKEDIPLLVSYFAQKFAKQMQKQIESVPSAVMKGLTGWEWPGNIRELENFIERAVILTRGKALEVPLTELQKIETEAATETVVSKTKRTARGASNSRRDISAGAEEYQRKQREEIIQALTTCKGRIGGADGAASRLGINRTTLMYRMRKLGVYAKLYS
jgi:formate hydrogenlyase transcriptional activator